ncbi:MAG: helix-turn-helix transcriptional regulator [Bacteroidetes bacterium]|nr:helix-turn-helix transcriptional regulator [Bacteroidota bacterium]MCH8524674.1 helix-turn-helix transcriptional regulator [Balneolales bacterium]
MRKYPTFINVTVEKTETGFSAMAEQFSVYTTGRDIADLYSNLIESLNFALEDEGYEVSTKQLKLNLDLQQFFKHYKVLNANFLAKRIGMNPTLLSQYVSGKKQPSPKQVQKIVNGIQKIGRELSELSLV